MKEIIFNEFHKVITLSNNELGGVLEYDMENMLWDDLANERWDSISDLMFIFNVYI